MRDNLILAIIALGETRDPPSQEWCVRYVYITMYMDVLCFCALSICSICNLVGQQNNPFKINAYSFITIQHASRKD